MSKIKVVQIVVAGNSDEWVTQYLDDKGRVWQEELVLDYDHCEYDELGRLTKSFHKLVIRQVELPEEPES